MRKQLIIAAVASVVLLAAATSRPALRELSDAEMDTVHAGGTEVVTATDSVYSDEASSVSVTDNSISTITLGQNAQQHLTSFVNILAVNSAVQILMNVNVSINSEVGSVTQGNAGAQTF